MSLTTKMFIFLIMAFLLGSFVSGLLVESNAGGKAQESIGLQKIMDTWEQSSSGLIGKVTTLATSSGTYTAILGMVAWDYPMYSDGIGMWFRFLVLYPISLGLVISLMILGTQILASAIPG